MNYICKASVFFIDLKKKEKSYVRYRISGLGMSKHWHVKAVRHCGFTNKFCFKIADSKHKYNCMFMKKIEKAIFSFLVKIGLIISENVYN